MNCITQKTILIVEDEAKLASLLSEYLALADYATHIIADGLAVVPWLRTHSADLIVLDLMLPNRDGIELCRDIRQFSNVPIIMTTARIEEIDRLLGLALGADDYICKPYSPREVVARIKAVLRRINPEQQPTIIPSTPELLSLDPLSYRVSVGKQSISLSTIEFMLLNTLHQEPTRLFSRNQLMDNIYSDQRVVLDRTVDSHIKKLRKKLTVLLPDYELIHAMYGAGYCYEARLK
ncbi:two-component system response regulator BaeR [Crenothrix sp. D3]|nr:two-component system response regulator BaeR [Crenothrix sp. D3]